MRKIKLIYINLQGKLACAGDRRVFDLTIAILITKFFKVVDIEAEGGLTFERIDQFTSQITGSPLYCLLGLSSFRARLFLYGYGLSSQVIRVKRFIGIKGPIKITSTFLNYLPLYYCKLGDRDSITAHSYSTRLKVIIVGIIVFRRRGFFWHVGDYFFSQRRYRFRVKEQILTHISLFSKSLTYETYKQQIYQHQQQHNCCLVILQKKSSIFDFRIDIDTYLISLFRIVYSLGFYPPVFIIKIICGLLVRRRIWFYNKILYKIRLESLIFIFKKL